MSDMRDMDAEGIPVTEDEDGLSADESAMHVTDSP